MQRRTGNRSCWLFQVPLLFCVIFVYLPLIYRNVSPFGAAVFMCFITTLVTMYMIGGATRKTIAATAGTVAGVVIAGISAWLFSMASGITGYMHSGFEQVGAAHCQVLIIDFVHGTADRHCHIHHGAQTGNKKA